MWGSANQEAKKATASLTLGSVLFIILPESQRRVQKATLWQTGKESHFSLCIIIITINYILYIYAHIALKHLIYNGDETSYILKRQIT